MEEVLRNDQVVALEVSVPAGHRHLRARLCLDDGRTIVIQEATLAAMARAYLIAKTDPLEGACRLRGVRIDETRLREGFADWQLLPIEKG